MSRYMGEHRITDLELRTVAAKLRAAEQAVAESRLLLEELSGRATGPARSGLPDRPVPPTAPPHVTVPGSHGRGVPAGGGPPTAASPMADAAALPDYPRDRHRAAPPAPDTPPGAPVPVQAPGVPPRTPLTLEQKVIRGIAIGGAVITVIGVALLIALAIQNGWLGPLGRVLLTAVLGGVLLGAGLRLNSRSAATTGVTALVTTSYLVFSLLVISLVHWLEWWPELPGALVLVAIHGIYLWLARHLERVWLSYAVALVGSFIAVSYLSPAPDTWPVTILPLLALVATVRSNWLTTRVIAGFGAVLVQLILADFVAPRDSVMWNALAVAAILAFTVVGLVDRFASFSGAPGGTATPVRPGGATPPSGWALTQRRHLVGDPNIVLLAIPVVLLAVQLGFTRWSPFIWLVPALAAVIAGLGLYFRSRSEVLVGLCAVPVSFVVIWGAVPPLGQLAPWSSDVVLGLYLVLALGFVAWLSTANRFGRTPWVVWLAALLIMTGLWGGDVVGKAPLWLTGPAAAVLAVLLALLIALAALRFRAFAIFDTWAQVLGGVLGLYLSMLVVVTFGTFLGELIGGATGMWLGYLLGHTAVSVAWMILAAVVLLARTPLDDRSELGIGVLLAAAATAKLVFFDLSALSGIPRVIAFLVCGVALLAIAAMRSRRPGTGDPVDAPAPSPAGNSPVAGNPPE